MDHNNFRCTRKMCAMSSAVEDLADRPAVADLLTGIWLGFSSGTITGA